MTDIAFVHFLCSVGLSLAKLAQTGGWGSRRDHLTCRADAAGLSPGAVGVASHVLRAQAAAASQGEGLGLLR